MARRAFTRRDALKGLGLGLGAMASGCVLPQDGGGGHGAGGKGDWSGEGSGPAPESWDAVRRTGKISSVVLLCMENRSFDHYFGAYSLPRSLGGWEATNVDGLTGRESNPTLDGLGEVAVHRQEDFSVHDLPHEWMQVREQHNDGHNDGFVRAAMRAGQSNARKLQKLVPEGDRLSPEALSALMGTEAMGYHTPDQIPLMYALAEQSVLCQRWFSSVLGPTWTNRFFLHGASSGGITDNHSLSHLPSLRSVYERLTRWESILDVMQKKNGLRATNFYHDVAWLRAINPDVGREMRNQFDPMTSRLDRFVAKGFFAKARQNELPALSIIDPHYGTFRPADANDDHPSSGGGDFHDIRLGQALIGSVVAALAENPDQWNRTLLIITYDEHGGFYDHVAPPTVHDDRPDFRQLGFRVPSMVIGPHVRRGLKLDTQLEHVSVVKTIMELYGLEVGFDDPNVQRRIAQADSLLECLDMDALESATPHAPPELPEVELSLSGWRERARFLEEKGRGEDPHDHGHDPAGCFCPGEFMALLESGRTPAHVREAAKDGGALERSLEEGERLGAVSTLT